MIPLLKSMRRVLPVSALCTLAACGGSEDSAENETVRQNAPPTEQTTEPVTSSPATETGSTATPSQPVRQNVASTESLQPRRDQSVEDPDYLTLYGIFLAWSDDEIPGDEWAERSVAPFGQPHGDTTVSEFNRQDLVAGEKERINTWLERTQDVGTLVFNVSGRLSEYDSHYNEFYIDAFSPGSAITFSAERRGVLSFMRNPPMIRMHFSNDPEIYAWEISQEDAVRIIDSLDDGGRYRNITRNITARVVAEIVSVTGSASDSPRFNITILSYDLLNPSGRHLARYTQEEGIAARIDD